MDSFTSSPPPLNEPGSVKRPLILAFYWQAFHPTDRYNVPEALQWLFSRSLLHCSEKKGKRRVFSRALSHSSPRTRGLACWWRGRQRSSPHPTLKCRCDPCLLPDPTNRCKTPRMTVSFSFSEPKWAGCEKVALTQWTCTTTSYDVTTEMKHTLRYILQTGTTTAPLIILCYSQEI